VRGGEAASHSSNRMQYILCILFPTGRWARSGEVLELPNAATFSIFPWCEGNQVARGSSCTVRLTAAHPRLSTWAHSSCSAARLQTHLFKKLFAFCEVNEIVTRVTRSRAVLRLCRQLQAVTGKRGGRIREKQQHYEKETADVKNDVSPECGKC